MYSSGFQLSPHNRSSGLVLLKKKKEGKKHAELTSSGGGDLTNTVFFGFVFAYSITVVSWWWCFRKTCFNVLM